MVNFRSRFTLFMLLAVLLTGIHVKDAGANGKSAVLVAVSPQAPGHAVWKELDSVTAGFAP